MASEPGKINSKTGEYTPVLPGDWKLREFGVAEPQEVGGPIGKLLNRTSAAFQKVDSDLRREADRRLVSSLRFLLKKIGATVLTSLHDSAMPRVLHQAIDGIFLSVWPEVEKGILDGLVLDIGFQFDKYRKKVVQHEAEAPNELFAWCKATLLYAMMPYDLSFFGMMRQPTLFAVNLAFLFPLYGVDSITIISLWLATYAYDEYQLTSFIVKSKGLAFITAGCITGVLGFIKLYSCAIITDPASPKACQYKAPGVYSTYEQEFWLFQVRSVLVWVTFVQLYFLDKRIAAKKAREAYKARLAAHPASARRGLPGPIAVSALLLVGVGGFLALFVAWLVPAVMVAPSAEAFLRTELDAFLAGVKFNPSPVADGCLFDMLLLLPALLKTYSLLSTVKYYARPALLSLGISALVSAYFLWALEATQAPPLSFVGGALALAAYSGVVSLLLVVLQLCAQVRDRGDAKVLEGIMHQLDEDDNGTVNKGTFKKTYQKLFPDYPHSFDTLWAKIDKDGDGQLSRDELAEALGLGHLRAGFKAADEEESPSEALARQLEQAKQEGGKDIDAKLVALQAEAQRLKAHHLQAGGVMHYFFFYDVITVTGLCAWTYYSCYTQGIVRGDWRYSTSLYFTKMAMGLLSAPFLVFKVPLVETWLTHARPTAYDRAGDCVSKLPGDAVSKRFADAQAAGREARLERLAEGKQTCTDRWEICIGTYEDEDEHAEAQMDEEQIAEQAARNRKAQAAKQKLLSEEEKGLEAMKQEAKRAFEKKQRAVMEARRPEASLLMMRRDEETGQLRLAGGEAYELM